MPAAIVIYLFTSLPNDVQSAVCNEKLKIDDDLYTLFWGDGSWYVSSTNS